MCVYACVCVLLLVQYKVHVSFLLVQVHCTEFDITDDDIALEEDETFNLTITSLSHAMAHPGTNGMAWGVIIDNDGKPMSIPCRQIFAWRE